MQPEGVDELVEAPPYFVQRIVAATGNHNKLAELSTVAREFGIDVISAARVQEEQGLGAPPYVEETGTTYRANALLKAAAYAAWSGMPAIGDDSGLEVTALDNRPGLHSARYGGEGLSAGDRINLLLKELEEAGAAHEASDRSAFFRCSLALAYPEGATLFADSACRGQILLEPRGDKGFGYDPIVLIDSLGKTLAEVEFDVTCKSGFRALAAQSLFSALLTLKDAAA